MESGAERVFLSEPALQGLWFVEMEDPTRAGFGIAVIVEIGLLPRALVDERERVSSMGEFGGKGSSVSIGLFGDSSQGSPDLFGFDDSSGDPIHKQQVIGGTRLCRELADSDADSSGEVQVFVILNHPASGLEAGIDRLTGILFGFSHGSGLRA
jgi:hypothetical protein